MKNISILILVLLIVASVLYIYSAFEQQEMMVDRLLRLHVVANSDRPSDQQLKTIVKDRVVEYVSEEITAMTNKEQVLAFLKADRQKIEHVATEQIYALGEEYDVRVEIGRFLFPTKLYGSLALPAGDYDALKVVIGEGKGANWWCVMFPPLCFVDGGNAVLARDQHKVMEMLQNEEYDILAAPDSRGKIPVRMRFKVIELINQSRIKIAEVFNQK